MVFKKTDNLKLAQRLNRLKRVFPSNSRGRFERCVKEFAPAAVLCTHYLPLESLAHLKRRAVRRLESRHVKHVRGSASASAAPSGRHVGPVVVSIVIHISLPRIDVLANILIVEIRGEHTG